MGETTESQAQLMELGRPVIRIESVGKVLETLNPKVEPLLAKAIYCIQNISN